MIRQLFGKCCDWLGRNMNYVSSAAALFGAVNFFLLLLGIKKLYNIQVPNWIILVVGIPCILSVGWFIWKYVSPYQHAHKNEKNDIKKDTRKILKNTEEILKFIRIEEDEWE